MVVAKLSVAFLTLLSVIALALPASAALYSESKPLPELLTDGKLHIFLIGTGDPEVEMQNIRKPACLAVLVSGEFIVIDAGEGAIQTIAGLGLPYGHIQRVFITHWHSDHFAGLGQVMNGSWVHGRKEPLPVYGPDGVNKVVSAINQAYELDAKFRVETFPGQLQQSAAFCQPVLVDAVKGPSVVYQSDNIKITAFPVDHSPVYPAVGYDIEFGGKHVVFSGDTRIVPSLLKQSTGAAVLINEAFSHPLADVEVKRDEAAGKPQAVKFTRDVSHYHSDTFELAKMAQQAGVEHLVLTHLVPAIPRTAQARAQFIQGMSDYYTGPIHVGEDGDHIVLDPTAEGTRFSYIPADKPDMPAVMISE